MYGRLLDFFLYHGSKFTCSVATKRTVPEASDMMPVHESANIGDLKDKNALYIEFEAQKIKVIGLTYSTRRRYDLSSYTNSAEADLRKLETSKGLKATEK